MSSRTCSSLTFANFLLKKKVNNIILYNILSLIYFIIRIARYTVFHGIGIFYIFLQHVNFLSIGVKH